MPVCPNGHPRLTMEKERRKFRRRNTEAPNVKQDPVIAKSLTREFASCHPVWAGGGGNLRACMHIPCL